MTYSVSRYNKSAENTQVDGVGPARVLSDRSLRAVEEERDRAKQLLRAKDEVRAGGRAAAAGIWVRQSCWGRCGKREGLRAVRRSAVPARGL